MISEQAKEGFEYIFERSAKLTLLRSTDDHCEIKLVPSRLANEVRDEDIFVLTISSFVFRILTIFHVGKDAAIRDYFHELAANRSFEEAFSEICNLCSGAINHELLRYFPHLGMSTPYSLSGRCLPYLAELNPGYQSCIDITINGSVNLQATICVVAYESVDFRVDKNELAGVSGELELF